MVVVILGQVRLNMMTVHDDGAAGLEGQGNALKALAPSLESLAGIVPVLAGEPELDHNSSVEEMAQSADLGNGLEADGVDPWEVTGVLGPPLLMMRSLPV